MQDQAGLPVVIVAGLHSEARRTGLDRLLNTVPGSVALHRGLSTAAEHGTARELVPPVRRAAAARDWHPEYGDRCQHLVFTSPGLDSDGLTRVLESCLLTDAEYAAGPASWKHLSAAFDDPLNPLDSVG
jgi:hypothetical protein